MSIKARLFGKPWQQKDPSIRRQAVAESDDPELQAELGHIAEHDESAEVRLTALRRINTEPFWLDARLRETDPAIVQAADTFLIKAVLQRPDEKLIKERLEWFRRIDDADFIRKAAGRAPDRALRAEALSRIDSPGFLGDRVIEETDDELALSLIERIDQPSTLERINSALRRKSKRRARAVEERLHRLQAQSGDYDEASASASRLVERAERLARGDFEGDRRTEHDELESLWQAADSPPAHLARRFQGAMEIVRRALETAGRSAANRKKADSEPATRAADASLASTVERLEAIENIDALGIDRAAELLGEFDRVWQAIDQPGPADQELRERALPILQALQKRRQASNKQASNKKEAPRPAEQSEQDSTDWQAELDAATRLIEAGDIAKAQAALRDLRSRLDRLKPKQRPREAAGRLGRLEGRLREMRNWEHWSNNKHRDELIERIEQLADSGQHPDAISAALKEARKEWQHLEDLEVLPGDKRRHAAPAGQWRRFQAACKNAFEQAQPFFEKRHEVQAENLEQLEAFLERARTLADDDETGIDTLKQFLKSARLAIRRLDDLPPKARGKSAAQLREVMDALSGRLDAAFETIENEKRRLVREAQALEHEADLKTAIEQAKALQARWQKTGTGRRRVEQKLWKEFRAPIDPLFEKLQGEQNNKREAQEAELAVLRELVEQAEELAKVDEAELDQAEGKMKALRSQWETAGRRPGHLAERFEKAGHALDRRLEDRRLAARRRALEQLEQFAGRVQSAWQSRQSGQAPDIEMPQTDADDELARSLQAAARRLADESVDTETIAEQVAENGEQARKVVIEMEFLAGLDSPPEDREARMNFQVERLAKRMSERAETPGLAEELAELRRRWYASFPQPAETHDDMAKRFRKCQNVLESMSGTD
ncbi:MULTISPECIES: DUF349 domain-containing protein [unclassified Wenzhouxiangella]|uniref:DUF349 domain-containing protein n=1 Tax=unclassified Wenzhouxiangella TaxID=2613841 RepID=UPI000E328E03|nr:MULTISPECIES: DUF349 domain-containing protein [unclassified Wenzhouxiangella]RFF28304.1 DUF349 domain-containing protein [Wenzhouxiangella sp. 15181]RFP67771.1 DUF349 domain-containing protein [Wenzhouxiangella sp. 15190]